MCSALQPSLWGVVSGATEARHFNTISGVTVDAIDSRVGLTFGPYKGRMVDSSTTPGSLKRSGSASKVSCVASAMSLLPASPAARAN